MAGRISASDLMAQIKAGGGKAELKTVNGETLTASMLQGKHLILTDAKGGTGDGHASEHFFQSNGVVHVIDAVLMP